MRSPRGHISVSMEIYGTTFTSQTSTGQHRKRKTTCLERKPSIPINCEGQRKNFCLHPSWNNQEIEVFRNWLFFTENLKKKLTIQITDQLTSELELSILFNLRLSLWSDLLLPVRITPDFEKRNLFFMESFVLKWTLSDIVRLLTPCCLVGFFTRVLLDSNDVMNVLQYLFLEVVFMFDCPNPCRAIIILLDISTLINYFQKCTSSCQYNIVKDTSSQRHPQWIQSKGTILVHKCFLSEKSIISRIVFKFSDLHNSYNGVEITFSKKNLYRCHIDFSNCIWVCGYGDSLWIF